MCVSIFIDNTISFIINFAVWVKQGAQEISYFDTALIFWSFPYNDSHLERYDIDVWCHKFRCFPTAGDEEQLRECL